jgi:YHS domain-containing protein
MAKDPVCGMFVEEKPDTVQYNKEAGYTIFAVINA